MTSRRVRRSAGFTLVELLVVVAIIGILVALLLPAVQAAREAARRSQCSNNLVQLILAVQHYEMAHGIYPSGTMEAKGPVVNRQRGYHHSWITQILPYVEENAAFRSIDWKVGVYHKNNGPVRSHRMRTLICPSSPFMASGHSSYAAVHHDVEAPIDVDNHGVFFLNSRVRYEDVTDGSSHTIYLGEKLIEPGDLGWMSGTRSTLRNMGLPVNASITAWRASRGSFGTSRIADVDLSNSSPEDKEIDALLPQETAPLPGARTSDGGAGDVAKNGAKIDPAAASSPLYVGGFDSHHPGGAMFVYGDGHVAFKAATANPQLMQQLAHRNDGAMIEDD